MSDEGLTTEEDVDTITTIAKAMERTKMGFLEGTYYVRCKNGHDDKVEDITRNHDCETCGEQSVDGGTAILVCPDGHGGKENQVQGITRQHQCQAKLSGGGICGKQCRR